MSDNLPATQMDRRGSEARNHQKRLACPFSKCFPENFDCDTPCTRRWGFDGFRLLNEHIRKYHSFQFSCEVCSKGFPEASLNENSAKYLDRLKDQHRQKEHSSSTDKDDRDRECGSPSGSQGQRKRKKKTSGMGEPSARTQQGKAAENTSLWGDHEKRRRHGKSKHVKTYPERMTGDQDLKFERWLKECGKNDSKGENTKSKYASLCLCLFGKAMSPPENPYYDYLAPRHHIDQVLASYKMPSLAALEARLSSLHIEHDEPKRMDPFSLDDNPSLEPTKWQIPQGPESGFYSYEISDPRPDPQWPEMPAYVADAVEVDDDSRSPMLHILAGSIWPTQNTGSILNGLAVSAPTEPLAYPVEVDAADFTADYDAEEPDGGPR